MPISSVKNKGPQNHPEPVKESNRRVFTLVYPPLFTHHPRGDFSWGGTGDPLGLLLIGEGKLCLNGDLGTGL